MEGQDDYWGTRAGEEVWRGVGTHTMAIARSVCGCEEGEYGIDS